MLANLTDAAKYTEPGGAIAVTGRVEENDIVLSVRDTGTGMSAETLPHVFDLFVQGRRTLDRAQGGLGLGLAIVRSLVELHGGSVSASSDGPGRGSTFTIRLPRAEAPGRTAGTVPAPPAWQADGARVLIVDDNEDGAKLLDDMLTAMGT